MLPSGLHFLPRYFTSRAIAAYFAVLILCLVVFPNKLPLLWIMFHVLNASAVMGWLALVILFLVFCFALYLRYRSGKWKKIRVIDVELPVMANPGY